MKRKSRECVKTGSPPDPSTANPILSTESALKRFDGTRAWFPHEGRFGIFIHFGLYTCKDGYENDYAEFKITRTPFGRDLVAELATACHEGGLRLGLYMATDNWHYTSWFSPRSRIHWST